MDRDEFLRWLDRPSPASSSWLDRLDGTAAARRRSRTATMGRSVRPGEPGSHAWHNARRLRTVIRSLTPSRYRAALEWKLAAEEQKIVQVAGRQALSRL